MARWFPHCPLLADRGPRPCALTLGVRCRWEWAGLDGPCCHPAVGAPVGVVRSSRLLPWPATTVMAWAGGWNFKGPRRVIGRDRGHPERCPSSRPLLAGGVVFADVGSDALRGPVCVAGLQCPPADSLEALAWGGAARRLAGILTLLRPYLCWLCVPPGQAWRLRSDRWHRRRGCPEHESVAGFLPFSCMRFSISVPGRTVLSDVWVAAVMGGVLLWFCRASARGLSAPALFLALIFLSKTRSRCLSAVANRCPPRGGRTRRWDTWWRAFSGDSRDAGAALHLAAHPDCPVGRGWGDPPRLGGTWPLRQITRSDPPFWRYLLHSTLWVGTTRCVPAVAILRPSLRGAGPAARQWWMGLVVARFLGACCSWRCAAGGQFGCQHRWLCCLCRAFVPGVCAGGAFAICRELEGHAGGIWPFWVLPLILVPLCRPAGWRHGRVGFCFSWMSFDAPHWLSARSWLTWARMAACGSRVFRFAMGLVRGHVWAAVPLLCLLVFGVRGPGYRAAQGLNLLVRPSAWDRFSRISQLPRAAGVALGGSGRDSARRRSSKIDSDGEAGVPGLLGPSGCGQRAPCAT